MIPLLANPWLLLAAVLALGASHTFAYVKGGISRENSILAEQKRQDELVAKVQQSTAQAIAAIEVKHVTVRQQLETEIREKPVYRDCTADDRVLELVNQAITGTESASGGVVSGTGADDRPNVR
jgi:hypothetical protein